MKQIQRTSSLLKTIHIFVQFVSDDLFKHVLYHGFIRLVHYHLFYFFAFCAAERIIPLEKKETYNFYSVLESNFLRENIELRLWHGCCLFDQVEDMLVTFATLATRVLERRMLSHCGLFTLYESSVIKVCN